jgi:hypothetical protein
MKAYNEYMNNIVVSNTLHRKFISCATHAEPSRRPIAVRRSAAAFACLTMILLGALTIPRLLPDNVTPVTDASRNLSNVVDGSDYTQDTSSCYAAPRPGNCLYFVEVQKAMEEYTGTDAMLFLAIDIFPVEGQSEVREEAIQMEADRLAALGYRIGYSESWTYRDQGEKVPYIYLSGLFTVEELETFKTSPDYGYAFHFAHTGDGDPVKIDTSVFALPDKELALTAAYADPALGAYLPKGLPTGFAFETAYRSVNQESRTLFASWHNSLGYIEWWVSPFEKDDTVRLTSVTDTKHYDLALYPVPRADSVPRELREIVENPIFRIEDLTREVVKARAYEVSDAGDTSGPRMRFSVLYGDILVEINVKGTSSDTVFELLQQIQN